LDRGYEITMSETTFKPDAHPESTCCDGIVLKIPSNPERLLTWAEMLTTGTNAIWGRAAYDGGDAAPPPGRGGFAIGAHEGDVGAEKFDDLERGVFIFDISPIIGKTVVSAYIDLYGWEKTEYAGNEISPSANIYGITTATGASLTYTDFDGVESTPFCDTAIAYASWSITGFNRYILNDNGVSHLDNALYAGGIAKFCFREVNYDVGGVEPTPTGYISTRMRYYNAEQGTDYAPRLVINYVDLPDERDLRVTGITRMVGPGTYLSRLTLGGLPKVVTPAEFDKGLVSPATEEGVEMWYEVTSEGIKFFWLFPDGTKEYITNL